MNFNSTAISIKITSVRLSFEWDFIHSLVRIFSNFFFFCLLFILKVWDLFWSAIYIVTKQKGDGHNIDVFDLHLIPIITPPHFSLNPSIMKGTFKAKLNTNCDFSTFTFPTFPCHIWKTPNSVLRMILW